MWIANMTNKRKNLTYYNNYIREISVFACFLYDFPSNGDTSNNGKKLDSEVLNKLKKSERNFGM